ncbi:DUF5675 family protein [Mesorhizobium sp. B1-1-5]|uniref:DUF5675 family protein n=1 Tax=Mesorhizobium sp. B1-1-5 TaxID=2589979 RepID=UPI00112A659C|nr:DUF5675 family protein [Mesorhizobium sp. B1-1-5]TPO13736.1 DUF2778 domain-containing protein [Mesorhizobium sp. B1-1-5]
MKSKLFALFAFAMVSVVAGGSARSQETCSGNAPDEFKIELMRLGTDQVDDHGTMRARIFGDIGVNNQNFGRFYENPEKKIPAGTYTGVLRYQSDHNFVQSSCGQMSREGDFLIEVANVKMPDGKSRTNILFHPGVFPSNSDGCILFGSRKRDAKGNLLPLKQDDPLVKIRREFYGTDNPISCPNKRITITITE